MTNNNPDDLAGNEIEPRLKEMLKAKLGQRSGYLGI